MTAQKLRYIDILVTEPWVVRLSARNGFPLGRDGIDVQIANPVSYLLQKMLVLPERKPGKQAKDMLYIHDTLLILADALDDLPPVWKRLEATLHRNVRNKMRERRPELFADVTDRARGAARIAASTNRPDPPSAERLLATCRAGLARIFDQEI